MKFTAVLLLFILIPPNLLSENREKKWIPIEPIKINDTAKIESNKSKTQPVNKWIENVKVLQKLLDNKGKEEDPENKKNWYSLDSLESN
jgi:hypothetical protein